MYTFHWEWKYLDKYVLMRSKYCIKYRIRQIPGWKIFDILLSQTTNIFLRDLFMCGKESMFSYQRSNLLMLTPEFLSENTLFFPTLILLLFMWKRCFLNGHGMQAFQIKLHFVLARETGRIRRRRVMKSNHRWFRYFVGPLEEMLVIIIYLEYFES